MAHHRSRHRGRAEEVDGHRLAAEAADERGSLVGPGHGRDLVAGRHQGGQGTGADDTRGPRQEHLHDRDLLVTWTSWIHAAPLTRTSSGAVVTTSAKRSATVVRASSARHASSAFHMARAMWHAFR